MFFEEFTFSQDLNIDLSDEGLYIIRDWTLYYKKRDKLSFVLSEEIRIYARHKK